MTSNFLIFLQSVQRYYWLFCYCSNVSPCNVHCIAFLSLRVFMLFVCVCMHLCLFVCTRIWLVMQSVSIRKAMKCAYHYQPTLMCSTCFSDSIIHSQISWSFSLSNQTNEFPPSTQVPWLPKAVDCSEWVLLKWAISVCDNILGRGLISCGWIVLCVSCLLTRENWLCLNSEQKSCLLLLYIIKLDDWILILFCVKLICLHYHQYFTYHNITSAPCINCIPWKMK